jgi:hypothetical protein
MILTPSGKTRVMVAQSFSSPLSEGSSLSSISEQGRGETPSPNLETGEAMKEDLGAEIKQPEDVNSALPNATEEPQEVQPQEKKKTLTNYIFQKLEGYGYPGRRLQEFKDKFVKESVSPDGIKDIQVELPDRKYPGQDGSTDTIENEDLKEIVSDINKQFGLNFNGAERTEGKWTIKFTSQKLSNPEDSISKDNLDQVYGTPSMGGKGKASKNKAASIPSLNEMIKEAKTNVIGNLPKVRS